MESGEERSTREQLILAGLDELRQYGVEGFSTRRVAKACGLSCAAPYKHFSDTKEFIAEIFGYVEQQFILRQEAVMTRFAGEGLRRQLIEVSLEYIRFLTEHPRFRSVVMMLMRDCNEEYRCLRGQLSLATTELVERYCEEVDMPPEKKKRKVFLVRSLIYSAAMFFDSGEMEYNEENLRMVEELLDREFDLP